MCSLEDVIHLQLSSHEAMRLWADLRFGFLLHLYYYYYYYYYHHHHHHHVREGLGMFPVPYPQNEVGPSISSSVVQCPFVYLVCISVPVLAVSLCPSSVRVVATFSVTVLFPLLCSVLPFFP